MEKIEAILKRSAIALSTISGCYVLEALLGGIATPRVGAAIVLAAGLLIALAIVSARKFRLTKWDAKRDPLPVREVLPPYRLHTRDR